MLNGNEPPCSFYDGAYKPCSGLGYTCSRYMNARSWNSNIKHARTQQPTDCCSMNALMT